MGTPEQDLEKMYREEEEHDRLYDPVEKALDETCSVWNAMYEAFADINEFRKLREQLDDMLDEAEAIVAMNCGEYDD